MSRLRDWRQRAGLTLEAAAERCGTDTRTFLRWQSGKDRPNYSSLKRIWLATGGAITPNDFYDFLPPREHHA